MSKKAIMTNGDINRVANKADANDVYTVQSDIKSTMYLCEGDDIAIYYHGALLRIGIREAQRLCEELQALIEDLQDLKNMELEFKGMHYHARNRGERKCRTTEE